MYVCVHVCACVCVRACVRVCASVSNCYTIHKPWVLHIPYKECKFELFD